MIQTNGEKFIKFWAGTHGTIGIECKKLEKSNETILRKRRYRRTHGPADWWLDKAEFKYLWVAFSSSEKKLSYLPMYILLSLQKKKIWNKYLYIISYIFYLITFFVFSLNINSIRQSHMITNIPSYHGKRLITSEERATR